MIKLDILGITFESPDTLTDVGIVDDIYGTLNRICGNNSSPKNLSKGSKLSEGTLSPSPCAMFLSCENTQKKRNDFYIFYLDRGAETNLRAISHEQTHLLHFSGKLHLLNTKLSSISGLDLTSLYDYYECNADMREYVAGIGCAYALWDAGYPINPEREGHYYSAQAFMDFKKNLKFSAKYKKIFKRGVLIK
jgi:hypothetical protein